MKKNSLIVVFMLVSLLSFAQSQQPNSITPEGKRSWAGMDSSLVYTFTEQNPEFPGGNKELTKFIKEKLQYPQMEKDNHIEGKVLVRFVINTDGSLSHINVTKKVSPGLDKEAVRIVKSLPNFIPGRQQGKAVKVYFNLPIVFKL